MLLVSKRTEKLVTRTAFCRNDVCCAFAIALGTALNLFQAHSRVLKAVEMNLAGKQIYALITGSSRGFGKAIADSFLSHVLSQSPGSVTLTLHGTPSSQSRISKQADELTRTYRGHSTKLCVNSFLQDFERLNAKTAKSAISSSETPTHAFLFNNSGILIPSAVNVMDIRDLHRTMSVNVYAMFLLSQAFINTFRKPTSLHIIHTSSLAALQPFSSWSAYCISKAASDMMHRSLCHENPEVKVLLWAPGPLRTDMVDGVIADSRFDPSLASHFDKLREQHSLIPPEVSAEKLMAVLFERGFQNGDHIDFYET